jgi:hypothetical protein
MASVQLKRFKPENMGNDKVCLFIGKRGTGKTTLVTDIMEHKKGIPFAMAMSGTEDGNGHYGQFVAPGFVFSGYNKEAVERLILRQKRVIKTRGKDNTPPVLFLMDDCIYDKGFMNDTVMRQLFLNGRHWKIFFMLTTQYCMDINPMVRSNVDYVFILKNNIPKERIKLFDHFFGVCGDYATFNQIMNECTSNYGCVVLDNTVTSNRLEDCVFWYKARTCRNFRVGSQAQWDCSSRHYSARGPKVVAPACGISVKKLV